MTAEEFYNDSNVNALHIPSLDTITLTEEDLYKLMRNYALLAFNEARESGEHNLFLYKDFEEFERVEKDE